MSRSAMPGVLIAIEGIHGSGKTTQAEILDQTLFGVGESVVCLQAPRAGFWDRPIEESALEAFLQEGRQYVERTIQPELDAGSIVILDGYFYSTIAHQVAWGANVAELTRLTTSFAPIPHATFLLDLDPAAAISRTPERRGEACGESEQMENLKAIRSAFLALADRDSRITRLNAHHDVDRIQETIVTVLVDTVLREKRCYEPGGQHECDPFNCAHRLAGDCPWFTIQQSIPATRSGDRPAALMD